MVLMSEITNANLTCSFPHLAALLSSLTWSAIEVLELSARHQVLLQLIRVNLHMAQPSPRAQTYQTKVELAAVHVVAATLPSHSTWALDLLMSQLTWKSMHRCLMGHEVPHRSLQRDDANCVELTMLSTRQTIKQAPTGREAFPRDSRS